MKFDAIYNGVIGLDRASVESAVKQAVEEGTSPQTLLDEAIVPAMDEIGRLFEAGEVYVPEMLVAAHATQGALDLLRPLLAETGAEPIGVVAVGTVAGDLHDIGKNLVGLMLEGAGFEVRDLGVDVAPEDFVEAAKNGAQVVGMSALLTTTMPAIERSITVMKESGVREKVKIIIGGAPITKEYADATGADGFAINAASAVRVTKALLDL